MRRISFSELSEFSPSDAALYIQSCIDINSLAEKATYKLSDDEEIPREYLDEILKDGHCTSRHSSDNIDFLMNRLIERPPDYKHPHPQYSTFESENKLRFVIENLIYASAKDIMSQILHYGFKNTDDIVIENNFGEICGSGVLYDRGTVYFAKSDHVTAVFGSDKHNPLNELFCKVKTAYPDLSKGEIVKDLTHSTTELFYNKLLEHESKTLQQAWALVLSGYNIVPIRDARLVEEYGENSWESKKIAIEFAARNQKTNQQVMFSMLFNDKECYSSRISYSVFCPDTKQRRRVDKNDVPVFVTENTKRIQKILENPKDVIHKYKNKALDKHQEKLIIKDDCLESR